LDRSPSTCIIVDHYNEVETNEQADNSAVNPTAHNINRRAIKR
jgi:hypothetical protein